MSKTNVIKDGRIYIKAFSGKPGESYKIKYKDGTIMETKIRVEEFAFVVKEKIKKYA